MSFLKTETYKELKRLGLEGYLDAEVKIQCLKEGSLTAFDLKKQITASFLPRALAAIDELQAEQAEMLYKARVSRAITDISEGQTPETVEALAKLAESLELF